MTTRNALFVKVKEKNNDQFWETFFDTAIGPESAGNGVFKAFIFENFSGGAYPHTPLEVRAFGARKYFLYH